MPVTMRETRRATVAGLISNFHAKTRFWPRPRARHCSFTAFCAVSDSEIKAQLEFLCLEFPKIKAVHDFYDFDSDLLNLMHFLIFCESILTTRELINEFQVN